MISLLLYFLLGCVGGAFALEGDPAAAAAELSELVEQPVAVVEEERAHVQQEDGDAGEEDDDDDDDDDDDVSAEDTNFGIFNLNPQLAKTAVREFWTDLNNQARQFTRNMTPSMEEFARRMEEAGFPSPLVHGFREIEVPADSILPSFVPNIPSMGPFNPATLSQEQIDAVLNPPVIFNGWLNPNTVTEIPGVGRFSLAIPPVNIETPLPNWLPGGGTVPSFIKYERIPGEPPSYLNFPELGILNPANAYAGHQRNPATPGTVLANAIANSSPLNNGAFQHMQNFLNHQFEQQQQQQADANADATRQLSVAGDLIQNSFDRLTDIVTGASSATAGGILGQNVIDPVLNLVRRTDNGGGGSLLSNLLDRTTRMVQQP